MGGSAAESVEREYVPDLEQAAPKKTAQSEQAAGGKGNQAVEAGGNAAVKRMAGGGPATAFSIPPVLDLKKFGSDVGARNVAINSSYQQFDVAITAYLGQPFVANWATFGKHASAHVGNEMASAEESVRLIDSLGCVDSLIVDVEHGDMFKAMTELNNVMTAVNKLGVLINKKNVVKQSAGMAMHFVRDAVTNIKHAITAPTNPLTKVKDCAATLKGVLPTAKAEIQNMHDQLADGNQKIYESMAPGLHSFLTQVQGAPDGIANVQAPEDDTGFLTAGFAHWVEARRLTNQMHDPKHAGDPGLLEKRVNQMKQGNMILVTHEQVVAQPDYDRMKPQMKALAGEMVLVDPTGAHKLLPNGGNWGELDERLGMDKASTPKDHTKLDPNHLPPLLAKTDPRYKGSIADYFDENATETKLQAAPKQPTF